MKHLWWIIPAAIAIIVIVFRHKLPFVKRWAENPSPKADPSTFASTVFLEGHYRGNTPKGARVYSYMADVSAECRRLIDEGMQRTFDIARKYGYSEGMSHDQYLVSVWPRSNKCEQPGFLRESLKVLVVGQDAPPSYDQGPYDKDPRPGFIQLCVAGEFRMFNNKLAISVVDDPAMTFNAARYEAEHAVLWMNDPQKYSDTADHSQGGGHPILTDNAEPAHFAMVPFKCGGGNKESAGS